MDTVGKADGPTCGILEGTSCLKFCIKFKPGDGNRYIKVELKLLSVEVSVVVHALPMKEGTNRMICT